MSEFTGLILTPDHEDTINSLEKLPVSFGVANFADIPDWQAPCPVLNQGQSNACVGYGTATAATLANHATTGEVLRMSGWWCYLRAQKASGFFGKDQGAGVKGGIDGAKSGGVCLENLCPRPNRYDTNVSAEATADAANHKAFGDAVDLREWTAMLDFVSDHRACLIGTLWMSGQSQCPKSGIEDKRVGTSGRSLGNHCRVIVGHKKIGSVVVPVCQNSHSESWGDKGRSYLMPDLWAEWRKSSSFCAFGFKGLTERIPVRRDWTKFDFSGSDGVPDWVNSIA